MARQVKRQLSDEEKRQQRRERRRARKIRQANELGLALDPETGMPNRKELKAARAELKATGQVEPVMVKERRLGELREQLEDVRPRLEEANGKLAKAATSEQTAFRKLDRTSENHPDYDGLRQRWILTSRIVETLTTTVMNLTMRERRLAEEVRRLETELANVA